jgi:hypothetical protein
MKNEACSYQVKLKRLKPKQKIKANNYSFYLYDILDSFTKELIKLNHYFRKNPIIYISLKIIFTFLFIIFPLFLTFNNNLVYLKSQNQNLIGKFKTKTSNSNETNLNKEKNIIISNKINNNTYNYFNNSYSYSNLTFDLNKNENESKNNNTNNIQRKGNNLLSRNNSFNYNKANLLNKTLSSSLSSSKIKLKKKLDYRYSGNIISNNNNNNKNLDLNFTMNNQIKSEIKLENQKEKEMKKENISKTISNKDKDKDNDKDKEKEKEKEDIDNNNNNNKDIIIWNFESERKNDFFFPLKFSILTLIVLLLSYLLYKIHHLYSINL